MDTHIIRLKCDIRKRFDADPARDEFTGLIPKIDRATHVTLQIAAFDGPRDLVDVSDFSKIWFELDTSQTSSGSALIQEADESPDDTLSGATWSDYSKQHAEIVLDGSQTNISTNGNPERTLWYSVWGETEEGDNVTLAAGRLILRETNAGGTPPAGGESAGAFYRQADGDTAVAAFSGNELKALRANAAGTALEFFTVGEGTGDVTGPASSTDGNLPSFSGTGGKTLQDSGIGASAVSAALAKVAYLTVTQPVDLDALESAVAALSNVVVLKGTWDASSGSFPGSGSALAGWSYIVSVGGTVDGVEFTSNDRIVATTDNASTSTYASNWHKLDYTDAVLSVVGQTGAVSATQIRDALNDYFVRYDAAQSLDAGEKTQVQENIGFDDVGTVGLVFRSDTSGVLSQLKCNLTATTDPGINNGALQLYSVGSLWLNATTPRLFLCVDNTAGAAVWHQLSPQTAAQILALLLTVDGAGSSLDSDLLDGEEGSHYLDMDNMVEGADTKILTAAERAKLAYIAITQAVDLDALESAVAALSNIVVLKGTWDASSGSFPGSGSAQAGWSYIVSVGGTVDGVEFAANDRIVATTDSASTSTYASNWHKLDYTDAVLSVAGLTGAISDTGLRTALSLGALALLDTVGTSQIDDAAVTLAKMANLAEARIIGRADGAGTGVPTALTAAQLKTILALAIADITGLQTALDAKATLYTLNAQSGTTYTLQASDSGKTVRCTNAAGCTVTVPDSLALTEPVTLIGTQGAVILSPSSTTLNTESGYDPESRAAFAAIQILPTGTADTYDVIGGLAAA